jgi:hypothetical protein
MQVSNRIYEEPSRLSQTMVVGLSIAVVLMGGWLTGKVMTAPVETTSAGGDAVPNASAPRLAEGKVSGAQRSESQNAERSKAVQFDWPEEFTSATSTPVRAVLPLASELPASRGVGSPWPAMTTTPAQRSASPRRHKPRTEPAPPLQETPHLEESLSGFAPNRPR